MAMLVTYGVKKVMDADETVSQPFRISANGVVRLEGTPDAEWDVESKVAEDILDEDGEVIFAAADSVWTSETEATYGLTDKPTADDRQITIDGNPNMEYRINLGAGSAGPIGLLYSVSTRQFS